MLRVKIGRYPDHPNDVEVYGIIVNRTAVIFELFRFYLTIERGQ